jgi:hypothetical protein
MSRPEEQRGARRLIMPFMVIAAILFVAIIAWTFTLP